MTKDFPDEPDAWDALQVSLDRLFGLERIPETLSVRIDQAFWKMVAQVNDPEWASSRRVGELYWWALLREDSVPQVRARMRQYADWTHYRIVDRISDLSADPTSGNLGLERLEALWQTAGKHPHIASEAFGRAVAMRDAEHALIWGDRLVALRESERASVVSRLLELTSTRDSAMAMLKHGLEVLVEDGESLRPLSQTRTDHSLTIAAKRRQFARLLGTSLIEDGNIDEGLSYLELGLEAGSDLTAVRAAARGYLSRGDTLEATQLLARVALEEELLENQSGAAVLGRRLAGSAWSRRLADAADAIDLATALDLRRVRPPAEFLQVRDMNGDSMSLGAAILGKTNVVAFAWLNTPSKPTLDTLSVHAGRWLKQGATTYVLTDEYPDSIFKVEASTYPNLVWLHDVHGDARRYFDSWRVPDYFVVNNDGSAQFHSTKLDDIPRKLAYLKAHPEYSAGYVAPEE